MHSIKEIFKRLKIKVQKGGVLGYNNRSSHNEIVVSFWALYTQEGLVELNALTSLYEMRGLPKVIANE